MNRYSIVTPVRNEEAFLPKTISCVRSQTQAPVEWVLVDDGSADRTADIIRKTSGESDFISGVFRDDRGYRLSGNGVVDAFYDGFARLEKGSWDFIVKLDGDLTFSPDYFRNCLEYFDREPALGIGGGIICKAAQGSLIPESTRDPAFHVRGAVKMYRRKCWEQIGGIVSGPCWDSIDELKANMFGWKTRTFPTEKVHHHRPAGHAFGKWKDWVKGGRGNYVTGYHPAFMFLKCLSRFPRKPVGFASCGLFYGFVSSYFLRKPRLVDESLMRYVRREQMRYITGRTSLWRS